MSIRLVYPEYRRDEEHRDLTENQSPCQAFPIDFAPRQWIEIPLTNTRSKQTNCEFTENNPEKAGEFARWFAGDSNSSMPGDVITSASGWAGACLITRHGGQRPRGVGYILENPPQEANRFHRRRTVFRSSVNARPLACPSSIGPVAMVRVDFLIRFDRRAWIRQTGDTGR